MLREIVAAKLKSIPVSDNALARSISNMDLGVKEQVLAGIPESYFFYAADWQI